MSIMTILQRSIFLSYRSATPKVTKKVFIYDAEYLKTRKKHFYSLKFAYEALG